MFSQMLVWPVGFMPGDLAGSVPAPDEDRAAERSVESPWRLGLRAISFLCMAGNCPGRAANST